MDAAAFSWISPALHHSGGFNKRCSFLAGTALALTLAISATSAA
jgi:hypothetical protein